MALVLVALCEHAAVVRATEEGVCNCPSGFSCTVRAEAGCLPSLHLPPLITTHSSVPFLCSVCFVCCLLSSFPHFLRPFLSSLPSFLPFIWPAPPVLIRSLNTGPTLKYACPKKRRVTKCRRRQTSHHHSSVCSVCFVYILPYIPPFLVIGYLLACNNGRTGSLFYCIILARHIALGKFSKVNL